MQKHKKYEKVRETRPPKVNNPTAMDTKNSNKQRIQKNDYRNDHQIEQDMYKNLNELKENTNNKLNEFQKIAINN
jgi:hypothetical protein